MSSAITPTATSDTPRQPAWYKVLAARVVMRSVWYVTLFVAATTGLWAAGPQGLLPAILLQLMYFMTRACALKYPERNAVFAAALGKLVKRSSIGVFLVAMFVLPSGSVWLGLLIPVTFIWSNTLLAWAGHIFDQENAFLQAQLQEIKTEMRRRNLNK